MGYEGEVAPRPRVEFGPPPPSFDAAPFAYGARDPRALSSRGLCHWLTQAQADLTGPEPVHTHRSLVQVTGSDGLQAAARFETTFNPKHERIVVHAIRVHRAGTVREAAAPEAFEIIQRELNMERAVYDGRMTAHMVIPDVREGDVVETLYSVIGANPALKGRFAWWFILQWSDPVVETRCTIRAAAGRPLTIRNRGAAPPPADTTTDGVRTLDWRVVDLASYVPERGSPPSWVGYAAVHVADEMTWAGTAEVFRQAYELPAEIPAGLRQEVEAILARSPDPAVRLVEGLRLVQGLLRYHSVSVGEGGYRPRPLEQIWATRYGDCKDGSVLLTAVLRQMGIEAVCALVNTAYGDDLDQTPPNPLSFNHCIVRARVGGRTLWLDSTLPPQAGDIDHLSQASFHFALPLETGAKLEAMPAPKLQTVAEVTEVWTFARGKGRPADLELTTVTRGWRADGMRRWAANEGAHNVSRGLREGLEQELQSPLRELEPAAITDDAVNNVMTIVERYEVEKPFQTRDHGGELYFISRDEVVGAHLTDIGPDRRREPLQLGLARRVTTTRILRFPVPTQITPWRVALDGPCGLRLDSAFEWTGGAEGRHTLELTVGEPVLPAARGEDYRAFLTRARNLNGISFPVPYKGGKMVRAGPRVSWYGWAIWLLIVAVIFAARLAG